MPTSAPNFNFLVPLVTEIWWGSQNTHVAIVPVNAYQRNKFELSSSISFGDMREVPKQKVGAIDFHRHP